MKLIKDIIDSEKNPKSDKKIAIELNKKGYGLARRTITKYRKKNIGTKIIKKIGLARNRYFNEAIDLYNKIHQRRLLQKKLKKESYLTREESISVLMEFEDLEYGDKAI